MTERQPPNRNTDADDTGSSSSLEQASSEQVSPSRWTDQFRKRLIEPLALSNNPPHVDARGVAFGLGVALGIPVGGHMITLGLLRSVVRYNIVVAFAFSWIINPFTLIPIYYGYYYLGCLILGGDSIMGVDGFRQAMQPIIHSEHFLDALKQFVLLDLEILKKWATAAVIVAPCIGLLAYVSTYRILSKRRAARAHVE